MPNGNPNSLAQPGSGDKAIQRAVISFLLDEHPARHTTLSLWWMGFGDMEALEEAIQLLALNGLLWQDGDAVAATAAARHFDWLELA
jgi:hypothetical protein